jgi:hypothetical protein
MCHVATSSRLGCMRSGTFRISTYQRKKSTASMAERKFSRRSHSSRIGTIGVNLVKSEAVAINPAQSFTKDSDRCRVGQFPFVVACAARAIREVYVWA